MRFFSHFMLSLNVPRYSKSQSCSKSQMTVCYLLHVDNLIILGSDPGFAEFGLLGQMITEKSRNLGLGTETLSEADGLLWTRLAQECAIAAQKNRGTSNHNVSIKSWFIFLHHSCTLTDYILLSCRSSKRNRIIFLICHRKNLTLRQQPQRINTLLSSSPLSLFPDNIFQKIGSE